jgi:hypothetical protein
MNVTWFFLAQWDVGRACRSSWREDMYKNVNREISLKAAAWKSEKAMWGRIQTNVWKVLREEETWMEPVQEPVQLAVLTFRHLLQTGFVIIFGI